jgi:hypothetical protein
MRSLRHQPRMLLRSCGLFAVRPFSLRVGNSWLSSTLTRAPWRLTPQPPRTPDSCVVSYQRPRAYLVWRLRRGRWRFHFLRSLSAFVDGGKNSKTMQQTQRQPEPHRPGSTFGAWGAPSRLATARAALTSFARSPWPSARPRRRMTGDTESAPGLPSLPGPLRPVRPRARCIPVVAVAVGLRGPHLILRG